MAAGGVRGNGRVPSLGGFVRSLRLASPLALPRPPALRLPVHLHLRLHLRFHVLLLLHFVVGNARLFLPGSGWVRLVASDSAGGVARAIRRISSFRGIRSVSAFAGSVGAICVHRHHVVAVAVRGLIGKAAPIVAIAIVAIVIAIIPSVAIAVAAIAVIPSVADECRNRVELDEQSEDVLHRGLLAADADRRVRHRRRRLHAQRHARVAAHIAGR